MAPVLLNSNIASLNAQRRLGESTASLSKSFERLSSGLRINRPSDDAAGLSIAASLNADALVFAQGVKNINDGISYLSVADGAMDGLNSIVIRLRELATQASSGAYSNIQRQALDGEAQALVKEYDRVRTTTTYNGLAVFDGSQSPITIQAGGNEGGQLTVGVGADGLPSITATKGYALSFDGTNQYVSVADKAAWDFAGDFTLSLSAKFAGQAGNWWERAFIGHDEGGGPTNKWIFSQDAGGTLFEINSPAGGEQIFRGNAWTPTLGTWYDITVTKQGNTYNFYRDGSSDGSVTNATAVPDAAAPLTIGTAEGGGNHFNGELDNVRIYNRALSSTEVADLSNGFDVSTSGLLASWQFNEGSGTTTTDSSGNDNSGTLINGPSWSTDVPPNQVISLLTRSDALSALDGLLAIETRLNQTRGLLGSQQSRLEIAAKNLQVNTENYRAAESRILDADIAEESANLVKDRILQQAGAAVLAQANQLPSLALTLLGAA